MSEVKDSIEDTGESMKRGAKKAGIRMEEGAEEAKDKIDQSQVFSISLFFDNFLMNIFFIYAGQLQTNTN